MAKPEFQLFPCIVCTLGYNTYVAGHRLVSKAAGLLNDSSNTKTPEATNNLESTAEIINLESKKTS